MTTTPTATALLVWLTPSMFALFLYGIGQGLVKQYIGEVSPARFCLYFVLAKAMVNLSWFFTHGHPSLWSADGRPFLELGVLAYVIDGTGWIRISSRSSRVPSRSSERCRRRIPHSPSCSRGFSWESN